MKKKLLTLALCTIIAVMAIAGSSLAWLQDTSDTVINTFTKGEVDIELHETKNGATVTEQTYKMVPGDVLSKDPTVTVKASSEKCYVFVKIDEVNDVDTFLTYNVVLKTAEKDGWTLVDSTTNVYYRVAEDTNADQTFTVLTGNATYPNGIVTVKNNVTTGTMNTLIGTNNPQLKFTAYAVQFANVSDAAAAWALFNIQSN